MNEFKFISESDYKKAQQRLLAGVAFIALLVYGFTLSRGVFPGESAKLMSQYSGIVPLDLPLNPFFGLLAQGVTKLSFLTLPLRLNMINMLCTVISAVILCQLTCFFIYDCIYEEFSVEFAPRTALFAGGITSLAFIFSIPIWHSATRFHFQSFDLMLVLVAALLLMQYAKSKKLPFLLLFAVLYGLGVVESIIFITLIPVFLFFTVLVLWKCRTLSLARITWLGVISVTVMVITHYFNAKHFIASQDAALAVYANIPEVISGFIRSQLMQMRTSLPQMNWIIFLLVSLVPWVASGLAAPRALNNERTWSQYILHITLTALVISGLANLPLSPLNIMRSKGSMPVCSYTMLAMVAGYLFAYWHLLMVVTRPKKGIEVAVVTKRFGDWLGLIMAYPLAGIILLVAVVNMFEGGSNRGAFADCCANEILARMGERTWFITDGTLDAHLQIMANMRGQELNLLCLQHDMSKHYLQKISQLIEDKKIFADHDLQRMKSTLELGLLPFLQDWFAMDSEIDKKVNVFGVPDFWYTAGITPMPEFLFFSGCRNVQSLKDKNLLAEYKPFWEEMNAVLKSRGHKDDPVEKLRAHLRRHMGFVANNLGVLLEDLEKDDDAYFVYTYIRNEIDPENISALFNRFEMARRGVEAASAGKEAIERELKDFIANLKHRYPLWSLSRYYGYVRSPEMFARLGWGWALSGQAGAAMAGIHRAVNLLPAEERAGVMQTMAAIYALTDDRTKSESVYQEIIQNDPKNRSALLGLANLAIRSGETEKAKEWLEKAAKSDDKRSVPGLEMALLHLINNDIPRTRMALQEITDLQPQNLQAWATLALVQLQQDELESVEKVILPRMENIAGSIDNYFIQITRAQMLIKKGKTFQRAAREALIRASILRPDIPGIKDMILQLDIAMNDREAAQLHARQVLRANRKHALANYVMGSLRLQEGAYGEAEDFLRRSVESAPTTASLNDLAEVLRRIRRFEEAEQRARQAIERNPELYVSWETLASILIESGGNLDEAEKAVNKSIELHDGDIRIKLTLAKVLLKKGEIERARETIRILRNRQSELPEFDKEELKKLMSEASSQRN